MTKPALLILVLLFITGCGGGDAVDVMIDEPPEEAVVFISNYIEQPDIDFTVKRRPVAARGIYVTAPRAGGRGYLDDILELVNATEINAMVIDVKTDDGVITYKGIPVADEMGISTAFIPDMKALVDELKENGIYTIARIVCFKDNGAVEKYPELYIKDENGQIWRDGSGLKSAWLNPYNKGSWDYVLTIAKSAAEAGFNEIQFDYIRFDTSSRLNTADFGDTNGKERTEIIVDFARYAMDTLKPYGVYVSADVYGTAINSDLDAGIVGQDYTALARVLDYICPMVYPSHYANGSMGLEHPDVEPYETILRSMELSNKRLSAIAEGEHSAIVRPWLQDFTAYWVKPHLEYGGKEREAQIRAVYDSGLSEWLLWDASVNYDTEGLKPAEGN